MDQVQTSRTFVRLQPFVRNQVIRRSRINRVLNVVKDPDTNLDAQVDALLRERGITIDEDVDSHQGKPIQELP